MGVNMFIGTYFNKIDDKNRIIMPKDLGLKKDDCIVMTLTNKDIIYITAVSDFVNNIQILYKYYQKNDRMDDFIFNNSYYALVKSQNRLLLPLHFFDKEVAIIGDNHSIIIMGISEYYKYMDYNVRVNDEILIKVLKR